MGRKKSPDDETPTERFNRIATLRVNKVLHYLDLLGNCANKRRYKYNEKMITKMFSVIESAVKITKKKFEDSEIKSEFTF